MPQSGKMSDGCVSVMKTADIPIGQFKEVEVGGKQLLVCHVEGDQFYAIDNTCTHDDGPLEDGWLEGCEIECPRHGARFDVRTGKVLCLPAAVPIRSYPVKVEGEEIKVDVS